MYPLRNWVCVEFIFISEYHLEILVMALLILNSLKAFDSQKVEIIIFEQKVQLKVLSEVSECSFKTATQ